MLWTERHVTDKIARRLNCGKNAVVGKAHRIGLSARPSCIARSNEQRAPHPAVVGKAPTLPLPRSAAVAALIPFPLAPKIARAKHADDWGCSFTTSSDGAWLFCNAPTVAGRDYCTVDCAVVFQPRKPAATVGPI